jgi:hypothetical protein
MQGQAITQPRLAMLAVGSTTHRTAPLCGLVPGNPWLDAQRAFQFRSAAGIMRPRPAGARVKLAATRLQQDDLLTSKTSTSIAPDPIATLQAW